MDNFVNLHVHSHFSIGDSIIKIPELVSKVKEFGQSYIALTDHSSTMGWYELQQECQRQGINELYGNEFYCKTTLDKPQDRNRYHLVLIAQDEKGLENINKMQRLAVTNHFYRKPLLPHAILFENTEGVFCSTACALSYINNQFINCNDDEAYSFFNKLLDIFGRDNVAIELQYHPTWKDDKGLYPQKYLNRKLIEMYDNTDAKWIINTFDSHVLKDEDRIIRKKVQSIGYKKSEDELNDTLKSNVLGNTELSYQFAHESGIDDDNLIQKCIDNTYKIAEKCYFQRKEYGRVVPRFTQHKHFKEIFLKKVV